MSGLDLLTVELEHLDIRDVGHVGRIQADLDQRGLGGTISGIDYDHDTNSYTLRMKPEDITQGHRDVQREWNSTIGNRDTYRGGWDPSWPDPPRISLPFYGM